MRALALVAGLVLGAAACGSEEVTPPAVPRIGCTDCTILEGGIVFDGRQAGPGTVVLRGDRIEAVVFGPAEVVAGERIDVSGHTVMPGLFDLHVHTPATAGPRGYFPEQDLVLPHFAAMLRAGVTSYLDLGTSRRLIFEHRARLAAGVELGPQMLAAGAMITPTGGHPCLTGSPPNDACWFVDEVDDVAETMSAALAEKPDVIKVIVESGVITPLPELGYEELEAIVVAAGDLPVIAHVSAVDDVEMALDAGVRAFAHMPIEPLPAPVLETMAADGATIVPTLAVYDALYRLAAGEVEELGDPALAEDVPMEVIDALATSPPNPAFAELAAGWRAQALANAAAAHQAGVRLAAGTDAGNPATFHGRAIARELALYVEAGVPALDALVAATRNAADLVNQPERGRLEPQAIADVVIVEGDAIADITAVGRVRHVYVGGQRFDPAALALTADPVMQLDPPTDLPDGATCLGPGECAEELYCGWQGVCAPVCSLSEACTPGAACFPQDTGPLGFCYEGDGCDPLLQDCDNGAACIWLGNAATLCWYAGSATAGQACPDGLCAPGFQCDFSTATCEALCDPNGAPSCPSGQSCIDQSAAAGIPIGHCG